MTTELDIEYIIFGYIAAGLTGILPIPQLLHTFRTKDIQGLSINFIILYLLTAVAWTIFGIGFVINHDVKNSIPLLFPNILNILCLVLQIVLYLKYKQQITNKYFEFDSYISEITNIDLVKRT